MELSGEKGDLRTRPWGIHLSCARQTNHSGSLVQDETIGMECHGVQRGRANKEEAHFTTGHWCLNEE